MKNKIVFGILLVHQDLYVKELNQAFAKENFELFPVD